jgi:hypothetical protein
MDGKSFKKENVEKLMGTFMDTINHLSKKK